MFFYIFKEKEIFAVNESKKNTKKMSRAVISALVIGVLTVLVILTLVACDPKPPATSSTPTGTVPSTGNVDVAWSSPYYSPSSVSVDGDGNIYVADATKRTVTKLSPAGEVLAEYKASSVVTRAVYQDSKVYLLEGELDG